MEFGSKDGKTPTGMRHRGWGGGDEPGEDGETDDEGETRERRRERHWRF